MVGLRTLSGRQILCIISFLIPLFYGIVEAQAGSENDSVYSLAGCINYALAHQPLVLQAKTDEAITEKDIRISLSGWLPQLNLQGDFQHYVDEPVIFLPDANNPSGQKLKLRSGFINTSGLQFSADQSLYNSELVFAKKATRDLRRRSQQNTETVRIDLVVSVSKAFYDVLLTKEQLQVLDEDIQRLQRNYQDAYNLYKSGLTDKIDYQQAIISLNNTRAQQRSAAETMNAKYADLKAIMGYPPEKMLSLSYDSATIVKETLIDTMELLNYEKRIEYQSLKTNLNLLATNVSYYKWSALPVLSAYYNYNLVYQNDEFGSLYKADYPNSLIGLKLTLAIFQGAVRIQNLKKAQLLYKRSTYSEDDLKNRISSEYSHALSSYKSNLYALSLARENIGTAKSIFNTVKLQYNKGVQTYLQVLVSETDLRKAELNYLSTLFQVLSSKLDLQRALGDVRIN